jgi:serine/threonine protein kinase
MIRDIPFYRNYYAVAETICDAAKTQTDPDMDRCDVVEDHPRGSFKLLSMYNYGTPLDYMRPTRSFDIMRFVIHLVEAGALLNLVGIVHRDIHHGNILVDQYNVPRLIDFNLSIMTENPVTASRLLHEHTVMVEQMPPDYTLINAIAQGYKDGYKIIESILTKRPVMKKIHIMLGVSPLKMTQDLDYLYEKSKYIPTGNIVAWFQSYQRKIDSWAIGVNLINFISRLALWSEMNSVLAPHWERLSPVLRRMCEVSPLKRIDCVQALYQLDPNSFIIKQYAQGWLKKVGDGIKA